MTFLICVLFKMLNISTSSLVFMFLCIYMFLRLETNNKNISFLKTVLTSLQVILKSQWLEHSKKAWILGCSLVQCPHSSLRNLIPVTDGELAVLAGCLPLGFLSAQGLYLYWTKEMPPFCLTFQAFISSAFNEFYGWTSQIS